MNHLGFKVERHLAYVYHPALSDIDFNKPDEKPFDHDVLVINIDDTCYLVDTGFANNSLRGPLSLSLGEKAIASDCYRISEQGEVWLLEMKVNQNQQDSWLCLYKIAKASRLKSSTTLNVLNRRAEFKASLIKSADHV